MIIRTSPYVLEEMIQVSSDCSLLFLRICYVEAHNVAGPCHNSGGGSTLKKLNSKIEISEFNINYFNFFNFFNIN